MEWETNTSDRDIERGNSKAYVSHLHEADGVEGHGGRGNDAEDRDDHLADCTFHGELKY